MTIGQDATRLAAQLFPKWSRDLVEGEPPNHRPSELAKLWVDTINRFTKPPLSLTAEQVTAVIRQHRVERSGIAPDLKTVATRLSDAVRRERQPVQTKQAAAWNANDLPDPIWPDDLQKAFEQGLQKGLKFSAMLVHLEPIVQKYGGWLVVGEGPFKQETWNG